MAKTYLVQAEGFKLSRIWRGYGSAIFFELGELDNDQRREYTLTADDNWSLKLDDKVINASDEFELIDKIISTLDFKKLKQVILEDDLLKYEFDGFIFKLDLSSINNDKWSFSSVKWGHLSSSDGSFVIEKIVS